MIGRPAYVMFIFKLSPTPNVKNNHDTLRSRKRSCAQLQTMDGLQIVETRVGWTVTFFFHLVHFFHFPPSNRSSLELIFFRYTIFSQSGGPLLRRSDNTFIGVISFLRYRRWHLFCIHPVKLQGFTKVHYYFDWISHITGLELPRCWYFVIVRD